MVSTKALAAIALTLMVACPIGLGYLFAFEQEEVSTWETVKTTNISDLLLNNSTPYYTEYRGTSNNMSLQNVGSSITQSPQYVTISETVTPYPITNILDPGNWYADVSDGWATYGDNVWFNDHDNSYVRFMVDHYANLESSSRFMVVQDTVYYSVTLRFGSAGVSIDVGIDDYDSLLDDVYELYSLTVELGNYRYVMVEFNADSTITISGIKSWPSMGSVPQTYNTYTTIPLMGSSSVNWDKIRITDSGALYYRVDSAESKAGTYPSTLDYTLDMDSYYPDSSWGIKLNSIGFYGDNLHFAGSVYAVSNGKITVDDQTISVKGVVLKSVFNSSTEEWDNSINGIEVDSTEESATIKFGGSWSVTATASILEAETSQVMEWHAGNFGFDKSDIVAAALLVAAASFVVLGMTGRMNGTKVGILALICGGASIVYLLIL